VPDHKIGAFDEEHPLGNHVVLQCSGVQVEMAHFRNGSVKVNANQVVIINDLLGSVGNSGFSDEPHLHI
jgi:murein DD-endopeptidase MepM/ murein hydrolase activator NlpD